jgi:type II secretory pathway pseudopilin PulG
MPAAHRLPASVAGFATIYVTVAAVAVILLITTGMALINPPSQQAKNLDKQRQSDLAVIQHALDEYAANHNGFYPATAPSSGYLEYDNHQPQCFGCNLTEYQQNNATGVPYTRDNWIPDLVDQGYLPTLPIDPQTGQATAGLCRSGGWPRGYIYVSSGQNYKLITYCTPTTGLNTTIGQTSPYCIGANHQILQPNPNNQPALKTLVDPKQPAFHYAIYSPAWSCL